MKNKEKYTGKWIVFEEDNGTRHVMPETDTLPHSTQTEGNERELATIDCPCNPKTSFEDTLTVIHNSFQDKEYIDWCVEQYGNYQPSKD